MDIKETRIHKNVLLFEANTYFNYTVTSAKQLIRNKNN